MVTRRVIYAFTLAVAVLFFTLYPFWFSWYFLVLLILIVPFDFFISLPGMLSRRIALTVPKVLDQGMDGTLVISAIKLKSFPAGCIKTWIKVTGDDFSSMRGFVCGAERGSRYEVAVDSSRSGVTVFEAKRNWTVSLIGLFCIPAKVNCRVSVLVLPKPVEPPRSVTLPRGVVLRPKPGGGFSEDYDLRPYRKGDPVRSVHWKLSAKFNSLIIREPLVPPAHSRLLNVTQWNGAQERDLILGRLRWVSDYLLKQGLPYYVKLDGNGPIAEITRPADLIDYLYVALDGAANALPSPAAVPARFSWVFQIDARDSAAGDESADSMTRNAEAGRRARSK